jgi:phage terminase large subunit
MGSNPLFRPSAKQTVQEAMRLLAARASGGRPLVVWQTLGEARGAFEARLAAVRPPAPGSAPIVAACAGRFPVEPIPGVVRAEIAEPHFRLFHPDAPSRYRCATGGRGSGKSHSVATVLVLAMLTGRKRILCAREIQRSLRESVHRLLEERIDELRLTKYFTITDASIVCDVTGSEIIFTGLYQNVTAIKSLQGVHLAWVEEAESVSRRSMELLTPTIREPGSEIWLSANPGDPAAVVMDYTRSDRADCRHVHTTFEDNPWLSPELRAEAEYLRRVDLDAFHHVWLGETRQNSDAQVLRGKVAVESFVGGGEGWQGPYFGLDFGFAVDPTAGVRCWVKGRELFVEYEVHGLGVDIDKTPALLDGLPGARDHTLRADSARPETISYMQRHGYWRCVPVEKWSGSIEDGIAHLRSYERLIAHPRCRQFLHEARLYSYKVDRLSGDVMAEVVDRHNHLMDALRYALSPLIRNSKTGMLDYILQYAAERKATPGLV